MDFDVAIVGAGMSGMATAARLQARGRSTVVLESHCYPGGCAGFFRRRGFAFDVGATTLVDFESDGVGGQLLHEVGMPTIEAEQLPGYSFWLPDRTVTLHRDTQAWIKERGVAFGNSGPMTTFWSLMDRIAAAFW